mmetsp:Transcript_43787/g.95580  ORF Transcript_43787/g.95580 Transcript_43787/m.95580 type:complete len:201 (-) Transcript_43787:667-1269(-)
MTPLTHMKKATPVRSWMPFWSSPTCHQTEPRSRDMAMAWPKGAWPRILLRWRSRSPRLSSTGKATPKPGAGWEAAWPRPSAEPSARPASSSSLARALSAQASTSSRRRPPAAASPSSLERTCMKRKSAGFAYCGQGKPAAAKCPTASGALLLKTTWPASSSMRSSNMAKMSDEGWCTVKMTVLGLEWARSLRSFTSSLAL